MGFVGIIKSTLTPNLNIVANKGVKAKSMKPSYPTKTVPNHYTTVTGL
jgi:alkaline phosphatase D